MSTSGAAVARPPHRHPGLLLGVLLGGTVGTGLRLAAGEALPHEVGAWPWGTLLVNVVGAFLLGALLETLLRAGPDVGRRRAVRVVVGSGVLGSLTTTSALALETVQRADVAGVGPAAAYALVTLVLGVAAAAAGVAAAAASHRSRRPGGQDLA
ncbi:CrcB family protein [Pseudokineococcus basanitobsidens]|uniref:Fluoride-specific ion channel FluC n=1 Tax=Pseudokineococcus basanitobsidens TaxID=1926649 RepID=A0ABU8RLW5_9ACTN